VVASFLSSRTAALPLILREMAIPSACGQQLPILLLNSATATEEIARSGSRICHSLLGRALLSLFPVSPPLHRLLAPPPAPASTQSSASSEIANVNLKESDAVAREPKTHTAWRSLVTEELCKHYNKDFRDRVPHWPLPQHLRSLWHLEG